MNKEGFVNIILIVVAIVVIGGVGYLAFVKKSGPVSEQPTPIPQEEAGVQKGKVAEGRVTEISVAKNLISGSRPKLSYNGAKIVYRRTKTGDDGLWVVNADGSGFKKLTSERPMGEWTNDFGWSYDDNFIYYITWLPRTRGDALKIVNVNTGDIQTLFEAPPGFTIGSLNRWLGENQIAFCLWNIKDVCSVKVVDVRGEDVEPLADVMLYFWLTKESFESSVIASMNTSGEVRELTPGGALSMPSVSPRATKIAYSSQQGIVVMDNDGGNAKLILPNLSEGSVPLFSPDGKKLVYSKSKDDGHNITESDIYIINTDGSGEKRLTDSGEKLATEPSWSADGKKIVFFYSGAADKQIAILEVE